MTQVPRGVSSRCAAGEGPAVCMSARSVGGSRSTSPQLRTGHPARGAHAKSSSARLRSSPQSGRNGAFFTFHQQKNGGPVRCTYIIPLSSTLGLLATPSRAALPQPRLTDAGLVRASWEAALRRANKASRSSRTRCATGRRPLRLGTERHEPLPVDNQLSSRSWTPGSDIRAETRFYLSLGDDLMRAVSGVDRRAGAGGDRTWPTTCRPIVRWSPLRISIGA